LTAASGSLQPAWGDHAADRPRGDPLARVIFALLVAACLIAFFLTQRLKHTPTAVQRFKLTPFFSPTPAGHLKQEKISFRIANSDHVTVTILDSAGNDVATLARDTPVTRYKQFKLRWNGRRGVNTHGAPAPAGEYRVRVSLLGQHRSVLSPRSFTLVRR
jgi:hypothetical protein